MAGEILKDPTLELLKGELDTGIVDLPFDTLYELVEGPLLQIEASNLKHIRNIPIQDRGPRIVSSVCCYSGEQLFFTGLVIEISSLRLKPNVTIERIKHPAPSTASQNHPLERIFSDELRVMFGLHTVGYGGVKRVDIGREIITQAASHFFQSYPN